MIPADLLTKQRLTDLENGLLVALGEGCGEGELGSVGWACTHSRLQNAEPRRPADSARNAAQGYVAACMGGEFGGEWARVYGWLSPSAAHLKTS